MRTERPIAEMARLNNRSSGDACFQILKRTVRSSASLETVDEAAALIRDFLAKRKI
jgi:hypothetical protein